MTCDKCGNEATPANLTLREEGDPETKRPPGQRWCPTCLYAEESAAWTKQKLYVAPENQAQRTGSIPASGTSDTAAARPASRTRKRRNAGS